MRRVSGAAYVHAGPKYRPRLGFPTPNMDCGLIRVRTMKMENRLPCQGILEIRTVRAGDAAEHEIQLSAALIKLSFCKVRMNVWDLVRRLKISARTLSRS